MRALILILNADPFATIRLPPLGFVDRSTRLRAQLMPPHACKHSTYTRHGDTKSPKGGKGNGGRESGKTWGCIRGQQPHMDFNS